MGRTTESKRDRSNRNSLFIELDRFAYLPLLADSRTSQDGLHIGSYLMSL